MNLLTERFTQIAHQNPDRTAVRIRSETDISDYTCKQLYQASLIIAHWLMGQGIKKNDRIALILENRAEWIMIYFGILFAGGTAVPIDVQAGQEDIDHIIKDSGTETIFASTQIDYGSLSSNKQIKRVIVVPRANTSKKKIIHLDDILNDSSSSEPSLPAIDPDDLASIVYTSGTTGKAKGVMLTHKNFYANYASLSQFGITKPEDNFLAILPLHHAYPFMITLILPLFTGSLVVYTSTLKASLIFTSMRQDKITIFLVTPQVLQLFYKGFKEKIDNGIFPFNWLLRAYIYTGFILSKITRINISKYLLFFIHKRTGMQFRFFGCGGAKLDEKIQKYFIRLGYKVVEGYGLSETAPVACFNLPGKERIGSVGTPLPGIDIKVHDPDARGIGELLIKGDNVMKGYYQNADETNAVLKNGWFHTGDRGYIDKDGYVYVTGRVKEIIVLSSGKNISAKELEDHYLSIPEIKEICVLPDQNNEKINAVIVPDISLLQKKGEINIQNKIRLALNYASEDLAPYKRIRDFVIVSEDLPKTRLGKIKRHEVAEILYRSKTKEHTPSQELNDLSPTGKKVLKILARETNKKQVYPDDILELDLSIDSLGRVSLMSALEGAFNCTIDEQEFFKLYRVHEVIGLIEQKQNTGFTQAQHKTNTWKDIFSKQAPDTVIKKIELKPSFWSRVFTLICTGCTRMLVFIIFRRSIVGSQNLKTAHAIICPNHVSYLDGILIYASVPLSVQYRLFFMGYRAYFDVPIVRYFIRWLRIIPVDAAKNLIDAMQSSAYVLRNNKYLCLFPEGARSVTGELQDFREGVGILSDELSIPLIPVYIQGAHRAWKPGTWFPRPRKITVYYGIPHTAEHLKKQGNIIDKQASPYKAIALGLRVEIEKLRQQASP
ncbi:MAG: AMP-binding protein [Elusimicrobia bacterium]|nr:AMP-binding protein [Elusimicrobiota bacterium]MBD3411710.1 AMP-binding protein [Elusimicrobiota bacterium]